MKKVLLTAIFCALALGLLWAGSHYTVGSTVDDFTLYDLDGNPVKFSSIKGDNLTVLMFIATRCPISNDYNERMKQLYSEYATKGVKFIGINSNRTEPADEVREHAQQNGFQFPVYKDPNNIVADAFGASVTPEIYVLNAEGKILYHGRIDDSRDVSKVSDHTLKRVLDALLAGQPVPVQETKAFGCTIKRVQKVS